MPIDYAHFKRIAQQARIRGVAVSAPEPEAPAPIPVAEWVDFDFALLNQVFGLRLNRSMSPLRVVRTIHSKWTTMSPEERRAVPQVVRDMVSGLQSNVSTFMSSHRDTDPVLVNVIYTSPTAALIEPVQATQFTDLVLKLEHSPGWARFRALLSHYQLGSGSILIQGPLVAAVSPSDGKSLRLKAMLEAIQKFTTEMENVVGMVMEQASYGDSKLPQ